MSDEIKDITDFLSLIKEIDGLVDNLGDRDVDDAVVCEFIATVGAALRKLKAELEVKQ